MACCRRHPTHLVRLLDAHPDHGRGRHDRPQADRAAGAGRRAQRPADREAHARRHRRAAAAGRIFRHGRARRVRHLGAGRSRAAGRRRARRRLSSRRRRVGRGRARSREGLPGQPRRHAGFCWTRSATKGGGYKPKLDLSPHRWRCSARRFPTRSRTISTSRRSPPTARQKAMCELLLADYTRRGLLDGVGIRLPSIVVRPGKPNKAASGFFSGIIREPLTGRGGGAAGRRIGAALAREPALGGRVPDPCGRPDARAARVRASTSRCRACAARWASRSRRSAVSPATRWRTRIRRDAGRTDHAHRRRLAEPLRRRAARSRSASRSEATFDDIIRAHIEDDLGGKIAA